MRLTVPFSPLISILQTKIGRQVDHLGTCRKQFTRQGMSHTMRRREKNHVTCRQCLSIRHAKGKAVVMTAQVGIHIGNRQARFGSRSDHHHFSLRMLCQQTQQFDPGVTRAADNTDLDHNLPLTI